MVRNRGREEERRGPLRRGPSDGVYGRLLKRKRDEKWREVMEITEG